MTKTKKEWYTVTFIVSDIDSKIPRFKAVHNNLLAACAEVRKVLDKGARSCLAFVVKSNSREEARCFMSINYYPGLQLVIPSEDFYSPKFGFPNFGPKLSD